MPNFRSLRPLAVCLVACLAATPVLAATINTTTKDAGGKPVAGVLTTLRDAAGNQLGQQTTDAQGLATFANVPAGRYIIQSSKGTATPATQAVEVTDAPGERRPLVSQAFCSALPVAYTRVPLRQWQPFASLVLEAAYEATMWAAVLNARRGASNVVLLTFLGGGAFGNDDERILVAMRRALTTVASFDLDVRIVSYGAPSPAVLKLADGLRPSAETRLIL